MQIFCVGLITGLGAARLRISIPTYVVAALTAICVVSLHRRRKIALLAVFIVGLCFGIMRGNVFMKQLSKYNELYQRNVTIQVVAQSDGYYENNQLSFDAGRVVAVSPAIGELPGKGTIRTQGLNAVFRGDTVQVTGRMYKTRGSRQFGVSFATANIVSNSPNIIDNIRLRFTASARDAIPEPAASFGLGLLVGQRNDLPEDASEALSRVGLTHIIAVSGYNLTIIILAVKHKLAKRSKFQTAFISLGLMGAFMLVTGFSASIVRASLVSTLGLWAWYYGRNIKPVLLILASAAITAMWYPVYLWSDIGWYLSFLAFFGVLVLAPIWIGKHKRAKGKATTTYQIIAESTAAQLMTIPLIMYIFGRLSIISLVANMTVVPLVPLAMLLTALSALAGVILPPLGALIGFAANVVLRYMLDVAQLFSTWQYATISQSITLAMAITMYGCLLFVVAILWRKSQKSDIITDEERQYSQGENNVRS